MGLVDTKLETETLVVRLVEPDELGVAEEEEDKEIDAVREGDCDALMDALGVRVGEAL